MEWRDPAIDPVPDTRRDNGFFGAFGEPECRLMGVQHQWAAQRSLTAPPTSYRVVGPSSDPWLAAADLTPGKVIPGVVGYEWDSYIPGCFRGHMVRLMTAVNRGSDSILHTADMIQATAPSGGRVFAMGTMELTWALGDPDGRPPAPQLIAFVKAALRDLSRPASPAALTIRPQPTKLVFSARLRAPDPRILRVIVRPLGRGRGCTASLQSVCRLPLPRRASRYIAIAVDQWGASPPLIVTVQPGNGLHAPDRRTQNPGRSYVCHESERFVCCARCVRPRSRPAVPEHIAAREQL